MSKDKKIRLEITADELRIVTEAVENFCDPAFDAFLDPETQATADALYEMLEAKSEKVFGIEDDRMFDK